ncbi:MAG TPA: hypothetical protein VG406_08915 [Isosphaeraceae bacterium]|nr:hypothetical protein [Isosphaeraceae bacterium]
MARRRCLDAPYRFFKKEGAELARRTRSKLDRLDEVLAEVRRQFQGGPLSSLLSVIEPELLSAQDALRGGILGHEDAERLALKVEGFMGHLPHEFGPRFLFDSAMIKAICEEWSQQGTYLSDLIIPFPSDEWGHLSVTYARHGGSSVPVDLILLPGGRGLEGADLLSYPFLCHELGHNVLFKHDHVFGPRFRPALEEYARSLQRRAIADRGSARQRAQSNVNELRRLWGPSADHNNWSHEIAVDVIALWTCGPAYLATLQDILEAEGLDPYQIGKSHPPYEVRSKALLFASDKLGWAYYTDGIRRQMDAWRNSERGRGRGRTNTYLANASLDLTRECVDASLFACETLGLPRCTPAFIEEIGDRIHDGGMPGFGSELLVTAWLRQNRLDGDAYEAWEREVKESLCALVTL